MASKNPATGDAAQTTFKAKKLEKCLEDLQVQKIILKKNITPSIYEK